LEERDIKSKAKVRATLDVAIIVKNNPDGLRKVVASLPHAVISEIVVIDTGSDDDGATIAACKEVSTIFAQYEDPSPVTVDGKEYLGDFSAARNFSYSYCTADYVLWIDADDVFWNVAGFVAYYRDIIASGKYDAFWMVYDYEHDDKGNCTYRHPRERITRREGYVWRSPIHEVLCATRFHAALRIPEADCRIVHDDGGQTDREFKGKRNAAVCLQFIEACDGDVEPRMWLNYGNSLKAVGKYEESINCLQKYLDRSTWNQERYFAFQSQSQSYRKLGDNESARSCTMQAMALCPELREAFIELADCMFAEERWSEAILWANRALEIEQNNLEYRGNPYYIDAHPYEILAQCYTKEHEFEKAIKACNSLLKHFPGHHAVLVQKALCCNAQREQEASQSWKDIESLLVQEQDAEKLKALNAAIPRCLEDDPAVGAPLEIGRRGDHSLCIHCGEGMRTWGYDSIEKGGVGGSETAVIRMSEALAKLGWHVDVFGYPAAEQEGLHRGVHWHPHWRLARVKDTYDIFVNWRSPGSAVPFPKAFKRYVWLHDVQNSNQWSKEMLDFYHHIICLSDAHRANIDFLTDEDVWVSRNGLDPSFWDTKYQGDRDPHRLVYASCPSRGLHLLLPMWPQILEHFPDAKLDIYYGFNDHFRSAMKNSGFFREVYETVMQGIQQKGITFHGMVDQGELSEAFYRAGIWAYPCSFPEISCITAMQAQTNGAIPVTTGYWALNETVQHGIKVGGPEDDISKSTELQQLWLCKLLETMGDEALQNVIRLQMEPWARLNFPWSKVAEEWSQKFKKDLARSPDLSVLQTVQSAHSR